MTGSTSNQVLTINGTGFISGDTVQATYTGGTPTALTLISLSATQIQAYINVGTTARAWSITVLTASKVASNAATLTVTAPSTAPTITSLNPTSMTASSSSQLLTITGTGFVSGDTVQATYPGGPVTTLSLATLSATQIQAYITAGTAATWGITVVTAGNQASNAASLAVTAPSGAPVITSVSNVPAKSVKETVTINGSGFTPGPGLYVVIGYNGFGYSYPVLSATATQIQAQFNPGTTPRTWQIEVIDSNGAISNVATFVSQ
jgi:hypothetical protein